MNTTIEKERLCRLQAILELIEYADRKIVNHKEYAYKWGFFSITPKMNHEFNITNKARLRLAKYYQKQLKKYSNEPSITNN